MKPIELKAFEVLSEPVQLAMGDGKKLPTFNMTAYSGNPVLQPWYDAPLVIDIAGIELVKATIPIAYMHDRNQGVGHTTSVEKEQGTLLASGVVSRDTEAAREVVASSKNGYPWQASVGLSPTKIEFIKENQIYKANGREYEGPLYAVHTSKLKEISVVDLGADTDTETKIAAKDQTMKPDQKPAPAPAPEPAPIKAVDNGENPTPDTDPINAGDSSVFDKARLKLEHKNKINDICATALNIRPEMADDLEKYSKAAIAAGESPEKFELEVLRMTNTYSHVGTGRRDGRQSMPVVEAAAAIGSGVDLQDLEAEYGAETLQRAEDSYGAGGLSLCQVIELGARQNGWNGHSIMADPENAMYMAMQEPRGLSLSGSASNLSVPGILSNIANKSMLRGFNGVEDAWRKICKIGSVKDFKQKTSYRLTGSFDYKKIAPGGELKHASPGEQSFTNQAETYGIQFGIDRRDIINDDMDAFSQIPQRLGRAAALKLNTTIFGLLLANTGNHFHADNGNYAAGAGTALSLAALGQFNTLFKNLKDSDGHPIGYKPKFLLVPNALEMTAKNLMNSTEYRDTTANTAFGTRNQFAGMFTPVASSYLSDTTLTGNSTTGWYLFADPREIAALEVVFLLGRQKPIIERARMGVDRLGINMRAYHDFGVNFQDTQGAVFSKGAS